MDGQWGIDEVYQIRAASYDSWNPGSDDSGPLKTEMDNPQYWGRPFFQATRFGESHDMVSGQDSLSIRIAARPPFGQGYQMAKAMGTLTLLSNGIPMLFMGQEVGETVAFSFDNNKEIFNSSWPVFQVEFEQEQTNGGYDAQIYRGQIINLPWIGALVLERR
jgi:1,4-alpha-glucan branching enzyme